MTEHTRHKLNRFALLLSEARGLAGLIKKDDEIDVELQSRGVSRKDLEDLEDSMEKVSQAFYNEPIPA